MIGAQHRGVLHLEIGDGDLDGRHSLLVSLAVLATVVDADTAAHNAEHEPREDPKRGAEIPPGVAANEGTGESEQLGHHISDKPGRTFRPAVNPLIIS